MAFMQAPVYDAAPNLAIYLYVLLAAIFVVAVILFVRRPKTGSTLSITLYIALALLIGIGVGWYGRVFSEHYNYTHRAPYVDCPNC
jgi:hypothetical protein